MAEINEQQSRALCDMRKIVSEQASRFPPVVQYFCSSDRCLLRYLRARGWDVRKAAEMLEKTLIWRNEFRPEDLTFEDIEVEVRSGKMYVTHCKDKEGRPILIMRPGLDDTTEYGPKVKYLVWVMEEAIFRADTEETNVEKIALIVDYSGCGMKMAGVDNMKVSLDILSILQNHYPERLGKAFFVNPPFIFWAFWKVIQKFLDPVTAEKVVFVKNKKDSGKIMLEFFDSDQLEEDFGGTNTFKMDPEEWKRDQEQLRQKRDSAIERWKHDSRNLQGEGEGEGEGDIATTVAAEPPESPDEAEPKVPEPLEDH